ncbi:hypothetical protein [Prochlorococcus sp. MIT 0916]|uniref:hypothetical protein n=1 Tax=Prochlorococcus sp. MIT 0916 TaxID=3082521 RepID=UPI0039B5FCD9
MNYKNAAREFFAAYDRQIRKDIGFWIKYRPSRWGDLLPENSLRPFIKFIKPKGSNKFVLLLAILLSLLFVGIIPTLNFIWSIIFRLWLILLVIPLSYWVFAITSVYAKVIVQAICRFIRVVFYKLSD